MYHFLYGSNLTTVLLFSGLGVTERQNGLHWFLLVQMDQRRSLTIKTKNTW